MSLPVGLPTDLPRGVYVVATFRSGTSLPGLRRPYTTCNWRHRHEANLADMHQHLHKVSRMPGLAAKLASAGMDQDTFVETLLERCAGVWIYLYYVLVEIDQEHRRLDELSHLPDNLNSYYRDNLAALRNSDSWYEMHLPVLAALTAVFEPVDHVSLAAMAGVTDPRPVRAFLASRIRPFLRITGELEGFSFYHDSLRAFIDYQGDLATDTPEFARELRLELKEAVRTAHNQICDYYFGIWGGLAGGLSDLAGNPGRARVHGEYGIRNLARHLTAARRESDLHELLACEHLGRNTWYLVHDHLGDLGGYLDDVAQARRIAAAKTDALGPALRPGSSISLEIRYRLIESSIISLASNIPGQLVSALVADNRWSPEHALAFLRNAASGEGSLGGLSLIASHLPPDRIDEAAVHALSHPTAGALLALVPYLSPRMLPRALEAVSEIPDSHDRGEVLLLLAEHLPRDRWLRAIELAQEIPNKWEQALTLAVMSDHFEGYQRTLALEKALEVVESRTLDWFGTIALSAVAKRLPDSKRPEILRQMLDIAESADKEEDRAGILGVLARDVGDRGAPVLLIAEIADAALLIPRTMATFRADALGALLPRMPAEQQPKMLAETLDSARAITDWRQRANCLGELIPRVPAIPPASAHRRSDQRGPAGAWRCFHNGNREAG